MGCNNDSQWFLCRPDLSYIPIERTVVNCEKILILVHSAMIEVRFKSHKYLLLHIIWIAMYGMVWYVSKPLGLGFGSPVVHNKSVPNCKFVDGTRHDKTRKHTV